MAILAIVGATLLAFAPVIHNDFVDWDDTQVLVQNDAYQGLSLEHLRWMFTTNFAGHYQPLTWLSLALDFTLWGGVNAAGYHFSNLLLHLTTSIAFFFVAMRLIRAGLSDSRDGTLVIGALVATLLFAVHPLRVESVAWATERRDVLSSAWLMLTVLFYLDATDSVPSGRRRLLLGLSLLCYAFSLLSKAWGITLPIVLLIIDVYPLRRLNRRRSPQGPGGFRRSILEKVSFAALALPVALAALWAQQGAGALRTFTEHPVMLRIAQAFGGVVFYVGKTIWPVRLIPLYEQRPEATALDTGYVASVCLVVGFAILAWVLRRRWPALLAAGLAYVVWLTPVLGLAQSGPQVVADRYTYIACMPWAVLVGGVLARYLAAWRRIRRLFQVSLVMGGIGLAGTLVLLTRAQVGVWSDSLTLWETVTKLAPDTGTAHANLAVVFNQRGEYVRAQEHSQAALLILPGNRVAHVALARASMELGDLATAQKHFRIALAISEKTGRADPCTMTSLAVVETRLGRFNAAEELYRAVTALEPDVPEWLYNLGGFLASRDRLDEAKTPLKEALRIDPGYIPAYLRLGILENRLDDPAAAAAVWKAGLQRAPDDIELRTRLAWTLATCRKDSIRDGPRALRLARGVVTALNHADDAAPVGMRAREALAAALAETGNFPEAVSVMRALLAAGAGESSETTARRLQGQLDRYLAGEALRE